MKKIILPLAMCAWATAATAQDDHRMIQIPVIVHVMYSGAIPDTTQFDNTRLTGNQSAYLTRTKVYDEVAELNRDAQSLNNDQSLVIPEFVAKIGNPRIHFFVKQILYTQIGSWGGFWVGDNTGLLHRASPVVDPKHCLNVYTGHIKFDFKGTDGVTPVRSANVLEQSDDAVNISSTWVGWHYRLLTHETGHWLGLWHTWDTRQAGNGITDIPLQSTWTDMDCDHCVGDAHVPDRLIPTPGFTHSNYNNFMDYSGCRAMFSLQQAAWIRKVIKLYRPDIWAASAVH